MIAIGLYYHFIKRLYELTKNFYSERSRYLIPKRTQNITMTCKGKAIRLLF